MEKGNKIRFVLWTFIFLIIIFASLVGLYSYFTGHGQYGAIRSKLKPIVTNFNNLKGLEIYKNVDIKIKAKLKKDTILVTYSAQLINNSFEFKYKVIGDEPYLYTKYYNIDNTTAQIIVKSMIDAIAVTNNHNENDIFEKFTYNSFYDTELEEGIKFISNTSETEVYLNIDKTILDTYTDEEVDNLYINNSDIENINEFFKEKSIFTYIKGKTYLYIINNDDKYIIYIRNGKYNDYLYKSIKEVINALELSDETKESFSINYPNLNESKQFADFVITLDTDVNNLEFFEKKDHVVKIEIVKEKTDLNE